MVLVSFLLCLLNGLPSLEQPAPYSPLLGADLSFFLTVVHV